MKLLSDNQSLKGNNKRTYQALLVTLLGNLTLAVAKTLAANIAGSSALRADALNSISDVLYSVTLVIGMFIALRPPDSSHPQGHRRFEPLVGLVISFSMAWAGYEALTGSIEKFRNGSVPIIGNLSIYVLLFAAMLKGLMYWIINRIAIKNSSPTLKTAAVDNLLDTISSFTAIAGIVLGRVISPLCDPIAAVLVSIWIFKAAISTLIENLSFLTGGGVSEEYLQEIKAEIEAVPDVIRVHQMLAEYVGTKVLLDIHINLPGSMTLREVHDIETQVEELLRKHSDIERVYIHTEPPEYDEKN